MNKPFYIFLFMMVFCCEAKTQTNLVYNGDFELYDTCPTGFSSPFDYQIRHCLGWDTPTYATSDYFNICSSIASIPLNVSGFQYPKSGNGYCGLIAYSSSSGGCYSGNYWWEYLQGHFISPLVSGHKYKIGFYFSLGDYSNVAVKDIGFYISQNASITSSCSPAPIYVTPQIINSNGLLTDTINWILISGEYTALGGEKYITVGHFADSLTTDTISIAPIFSSPFSYYYVDASFTYDVTDDIDLNKCEIIIPNIFTPNADNLNDVFNFSTCTKVLKTTIFNRWGNLIYETNNQYHVWDGRTTSGEQCVDGNYYYIIHTVEKIYKGFIQLVR